MSESYGKARLALAAGLPLAVGMVLRLWMLKRLFEAEGDALVYGDLAKNLLLHGSFALTLPSGEIYPTLIRLPGYPIFLAVCFRIFGIGNYFAVACVQIGLGLLGCVLLADFARRIAPAPFAHRAGLATLWLAALCPFTASYMVLPLAEAPTLFMLALAMWAAVRFRETPGWSNALWFTFAVTWEAFLRPEGALVAVAFVPALFAGWLHSDVPGKILARKMMRMAAICMTLALVPFAVWTARNWHVFHVIQPLAPPTATDPDESLNEGWERWMKTWCLDYVSTYQIYWDVPWEKLNVGRLPNRAFDSRAERAETVALANDYNRSGMEITPEINARFERLAEERIHANPLRYYLWLPLGRVADMWLRPRVENLPIDLDWWVYARHRVDTRFGWAWVGLNAIYLLLGIGGLWPPQRRGPVSAPKGQKTAFWSWAVLDSELRPQFWGAMLAYILLRSALLLSVVAPETRYTLECFPILFVLGGVAVARAIERFHLPAKLKASPGTP